MARAPKNRADQEKPLTRDQIQLILDSDADARTLAYLLTVSEETIERVRRKQYVPPEYTNGRKKLSDFEAHAVMALKGWKGVTAHQIAAHFGIDVNTVYNYWSGDNGRHIEPPADGSVRAKDWPIQMLALILEKPRSPTELQELLNLSNATIHRGLRLLRAAGFDIPGEAEDGKAANKRLYGVENVKLTSPLVRSEDQVILEGREEES